MKTTPLFFQSVLLAGMLAGPAFGTTMNSLSDFGGIEEPQVIYHVSSNSFTNDSFVNITNVTTGTFQSLLRYSSSQWDGDRTTSNTDRGRAEVKTLGTHQMKGDTFDYTTTWRTNSAFKGSGRFCHITQLKSVDGAEGSSGAPMITTSIGSGTSSAVVQYCSAEFSPTNVFSPKPVRNITFSPANWTAEKIRVKATGDGQHTGEVLVSLNGDSFQGVTNVEVCRPQSTEYYPKWGFYRKQETSSGFSANDYIQHSNVSAGPSSGGGGSVAAPTFSPAGGTFSSAQSVTITTSTSGASIRYTTDGSTPTSASGTVYSGAVAISSTTTLKAIAYASGMTDSAVTSATYTIGSGTGGTFWEAESLTRTTSGAAATTDTDAAASGGARVTLNATATGSWVEFTVPSVPAGTYNVAMAYKTNANRGVLSLKVDGTQVGGTLDQYAATSSYPSQTFGVVTLSAGNHLVRLTVTGKNSASSSYTLSADSFTLTAATGGTVATPTISPAGGTFTSAQTVTLNTTTAGASIRYTTDGSAPTSSSGTVYSSPFTVSSSATVRAIAYASGLSDSAVASATFTISSGTQTVALEAESLTRTTSGVSATNDTDASASGGVRVTLNATSTGSWVEFTLPNIPAGTYSLQLAYKTNNNRGQSTFKVDGATVGSTLDQYASSGTYPTATIATVTFGSTGNHTFRMTVSGKNSSSSSYTLSADKITLVGQ